MNKRETPWDEELDDLEDFEQEESKPNDKTPKKEKAPLNLSKTIKEKEKNFKPLTLDFLRERKILEEHKIQLIAHKAKRKICIGGKGSGKSIMSIIRLIMLLETYPLAHAYGFRKFHLQSSEKMRDYFFYVLNLLIKSGYVPRNAYHSTGNRIYGLKSRKNMRVNSFMQMGALEDPSGTDGGAPANGGYFAIKVVDEPIVKEDMLDSSKIPTQEQWEDIMGQIDDNLGRFNDAFAYNHNIPLDKMPQLEEWYTMNDYGKHPLSNEVHEALPQDDFVYKITGYRTDDLLGNAELINSLQVFDASKGETYLDSKWAKMWRETTHMEYEDVETSTLYYRNTKFDNPLELIDEKFEHSLKLVAKGFITSNWMILARIAGLQYKAQFSSELKVYNINTFNEQTLEEFRHFGYDIEKISFGVDIDTSRVFTITPALMGVQYIEKLDGTIKCHKKIFIDKQIEIVANGTGEFGELNDLNVKLIAEAIKKYLRKVVSDSHIADSLGKTYLVVDDNRKHYLKGLKDHLEGSYISVFQGAVKHGHYDIISRQDYVETSFNDGIIKLHRSNKALMDDFTECIKSNPNATTRITDGNTNYLDRIDSMEYAIYPFIGLLTKKGGTTKTIKEE